MIFQNLIEMIRRIIKRMFGKKDIVERAIEKDVVVSEEMARRIDLYSDIYRNKAPWLNENVRSTGIAASVAQEFARLVTIEFESEISGNDFLNKEYQAFLKDLRRNIEYAAAKGGIAFKPYLSDGHIEVDVVQADGFFPVKFNSRDEVLAAVLPEEIVQGKYKYTRIEYHEFTDQGEMILNKAFRKRSDDTSDSLGREVELNILDEWEDLEPETLIAGVDRPLFVYLRMPSANNIDSSSPIGLSVFDRAIPDIKDVDEQWSRIIWEYEGSELAIDADEGMFYRDEATGELKLPKGKERLFRTMDFAGIEVEAKDGYHPYSPEIRDQSLFNGLNNILRQIEFKCGLAYGTLSNPENVDKTAEEIKASKQRSYSTVKDIQNATQDALDHLIYAMWVWQKIGNMGASNYDVSYKWDDSIVVDREKELLSMQQDASLGFIRKELYIAKKYGVSEEEALKMMPAVDTRFQIQEE